jgi:ribonuclease HII
MHVANVEALRRALARLEVRPEYALTDGFPVDGIGVPGLAVWKGDRVAGCIAAASIVAKVTRDAIMTELGEVFPEYDFATHKGYVTPEHTDALERHGPCPEHRRRFVNVRRAGLGVARPADDGIALDMPMATLSAGDDPDSVPLPDAIMAGSGELPEDEEDVWAGAGREVRDEC